jgi:TolA-binding protein
VRTRNRKNYATNDRVAQLEDRLRDLNEHVGSLRAQAAQTDERFNRQAATVHYTVTKVDDLFVATAREYRYRDSGSVFGHTVTLAETHGASKASAVRKLKAVMTPRVQPVFVEDKVEDERKSVHARGWIEG